MDSRALFMDFRALFMVFRALFMDFRFIYCFIMDFRFIIGIFQKQVDIKNNNNKKRV